MYIIDIRTSANISRDWADKTINEIREEYLFRESDVKNIADAVLTEQQDRIDSQRNRFDGGLRSLKISTIMQKGHNKALFRTGGLRNSWVTRKIKDGYRVTVTGKYKDIAGMLNDGTSRMEAFNAFGVEPGTKIDKDIDRIIQRILNPRGKAA